MSQLQAGNHEVQVVDAGLGKTQSGTEYVEIRFADANGDTARGLLYLTPKAWPRARQTLAMLGWDAEQRGYQFEDFNFSPSPITGAACNIEVAEEEYNGTKQLKVKWINKPGGPDLRRLTDAEANEIGESLRAKLTDAPQPELPIGEDDGLPF